MIGAHAAILVFDVMNTVSFDLVGSWAKEAMDKGEKDIILVVAANKCDLKTEKPAELVDEKQIEDFAKSIDASLFYTSAKTGENVNALFTTLAKQIIRCFAARMGRARAVSFGEPPNLPDGGCC